MTKKGTNGSVQNTDNGDEEDDIGSDMIGSRGKLALTPPLPYLEAFFQCLGVRIVFRFFLFFKLYM